MVVETAADPTRVGGCSPVRRREEEVLNGYHEDKANEAMDKAVVWHGFSCLL
jgi:hypothetical protein